MQEKMSQGRFKPTCYATRSSKFSQSFRTTWNLRHILSSMRPKPQIFHKVFDENWFAVAARHKKILQIEFWMTGSGELPGWKIDEEMSRPTRLTQRHPLAAARITFSYVFRRQHFSRLHNFEMKTFEFSHLRV